MSRYLLLDIGAGTMDVLYHDEGSGIHYKAVVRSPVISLAETIEAVKGKLLITGVEMGEDPSQRFLADVQGRPRSSCHPHLPPQSITTWTAAWLQS